LPYAPRIPAGATEDGDRQDPVRSTELLILETCGHAVHKDRPERLTETVVALSTRSAARRGDLRHAKAANTVASANCPPDGSCKAFYFPGAQLNADTWVNLDNAPIRRAPIRTILSVKYTRRAVVIRRLVSVPQLAPITVAVIRCRRS